MNNKKLPVLILVFSLFFSLLTSCASFTRQNTYRQMKDDLNSPVSADIYQSLRQQSEGQTKSITSTKNEEKPSFTAQAQKLDAMQKRWAETIHLSLPASPFFDFLTEQSRKIREMAKTDAIQTELEKGIDIDTLITVAVTRNPKLKAALKQWESKLERYSQATRLDNILRQYQSFIDDLNLRSSQMKHKAPIMKNFPFPGMLALKGDLVDQSVKLAREHYMIVLRDLITEIRVTYDALQYNEESIKIMEENLEILLQLEQTALTKFKTSKASFSNVVKVQIRIEQLDDDLITLRQFRGTILAKLKELLNFDAAWQLGPAKPAPLKEMNLSVDALFETGKQYQQEIRIAQIKIEQTNLAILLAEKSVYPDFTSGLSMPGLSVLEAGQSALPARMKKIQTPFWFGKNDAYLREVRLKYQALHQNLKALEDRLLYRITKFHFEISTAERDVVLYRDSLLQLSKAALDVAVVEYRAGKIAFLDVLDAEATWLKYKLLFHQSVRNQNQSIAKMEQVVGRSLR